MEDTLIYDTGILYNQHMDEDAQARFGDFYSALFANYNVKTIHDCSIGAGGTTLPLAKMGYTVSGSDLNKNLLNRTKVNFNNNSFSPNLFISDFCEIGTSLAEHVDCIMSSGNSLPHVDLEGFNTFLRSASKKLNENGLLFFDIRNWDIFANEKPIIQAKDPHVMTDNEHRSLYLLLNWHDNGSVTFSFATSTDKNGKHISMDIIKCPTYYPLLKRDISISLEKNGYRLVKYLDMDNVHNLWTKDGKIKTGDFEQDFQEIQWYGVLAQRRE